MKKFCAYLIMGIIALTLAMPFVWALLTSLLPLEQAYLPPQNVRDASVQWNNYPDALSRLPFMRFMLNSLVISTASVFGTVLSTSMAGYAFARLQWRGRRFWFALLLATLLIPAQIYLIPHFLLYSRLGWVNTYKPLIVPSYLAADGFYVFLFRQFFRSIPRAFEEAALIEGASHWQIYRRIMLPLVRPAVVTVVVMNFIYHWHDFVGPLIYLNDVEKFPVALGLRMYQTMEGDWINLLMAASIMSVAPLALLFLCAQRYIRRGLLFAAVKK